MAEKNVIQVYDSETKAMSAIATTSTAGEASFDEEDFLVDTNGHVYARQKVGAIQYLGTVKSSSSGTLTWTINEEISPKKYRDIKLGDLIMATETSSYCEVCDIFTVISILDGVVKTSDIRMMSLRGEKGEKGDAATVSVGSTTTGKPGTEAKVENVGTEYAARFNFTIPQGEKGDKGDTGEVGNLASLLTFVKTYPSVEAMWEDDSDDVELNQLVIIDTGDPDMEEDSQIYLKLRDGWLYLADISGKQGRQGYSITDTEVTKGHLWVTINDTDD